MRKFLMPILRFKILTAVKIFNFNGKKFHKHFKILKGVRFFKFQNRKHLKFHKHFEISKPQYFLNFKIASFKILISKIYKSGELKFKCKQN